MKKEIFISMDIEADGKFPGLSSMLSFAGAAFDLDKNLISTFSRNLNLLPNAVPDPDTMAFWNKTPGNQRAYELTRTNIVDPEIAMNDFQDWLNSLGGIPIFVGYPAVYDFKWIDYYAIVFLGENPFGFSRSIDVKSLAYSRLSNGNFTHCTKRNFPKRWFDNLPHTHVALDDCIEQGAMFINILREIKGLPSVGSLVL